MTAQSKAEVKEGTKAAPKKAAVKKPVAKKKVVVDAIQDTANLVENLTRAKAYELVKELAGDADFMFFKLGGVLSAIQSNDWYIEEGFENFRDFVEEEFGIKYRKAMYMIEIYNNLVDAEIPWSKVKAIGWTKLKELAKILDADNVDDWITIAEDNTVIQLQEEIKKALKGDAPAKAPKGDDKKEKVTTKTFKMHTDQKEIIEEALGKGKTDAGTDVDTVALEAICMSYLNSDAKPKPAKATKQKPLADMMKDAGWEEVLEKFDDLFPDIDISVEA